MQDTGEQQAADALRLAVRQLGGHEGAVISAAGRLTFPDAVHLSAVGQQVLSQRPPLVLLDLTETEAVDTTGLAVLVGIGGDLTSAGIQVRVVSADPVLRHRLPYTRGLRRVFASVEDALQVDD